jgi:hypothetical protein
LNLQRVDESTFLEIAAKKDLWDETFIRDSNIGGRKQSTFFVAVTPGSCSKPLMIHAATGGAPAVACIDGTGRLNYQGKLIGFVGALDIQQHVHLIAMFMYFKGETEVETIRALNVIRSSISIVHKAQLQARNEGSPTMYDTTKIPDDYEWRPTFTVNDGAHALFNSWTRLRDTPPS